MTDRKPAFVAPKAVTFKKVSCARSLSVNGVHVAAFKRWPPKPVDVLTSRFCSASSRDPRLNWSTASRMRCAEVVVDTHNRSLAMRMIEVLATVSCAA